MTRIAIGLLATFLLAQPAAAQYRGARSGDYLFGASAWGARAVWVNPAAQGTVDEASVMLEGMVERDAEGSYPFSQYTIGFNSRGFGLGFRRDMFPNDSAGNTWRFSVGRGLRSLAIGAVLSMYSGPDVQEAVDIGLRYRVASGLDLALLAENIGQPVVRDSALRFGGAAGISWTALRGSIGVDLEARGNQGIDGAGLVTALRGGVRLYMGNSFPLGLQGLVELDDDFDLGRLLLSLSFGRESLAALVGGGRDVDGTSRMTDLSLLLQAGKQFP
jgi:hypothetical protein